MRCFKSLSSDADHHSRVFRPRGKQRKFSDLNLVESTHHFYQTGSLTSQLSENPQKVNGLAGITLGAIVQSIATLVSGSILGLCFIWKVALVAIACIPLLVSAGYIRLVSQIYHFVPSISANISQRVVVLKDQANKRAHEESAQLACEAAGSIRTVASLTREADCLRLYSESLEAPLRQSNRTAIWSNLLYSLSQSMVFFVIALVFWYGSTLVSRLEASIFDFFIALMVCIYPPTSLELSNLLIRARPSAPLKPEMSFLSSPTSRLPVALGLILSSSSIPSLKLMRNRKKAR